jgi:molecular chaperone GrpE
MKKENTNSDQNTNDPQETNARSDGDQAAGPEDATQANHGQPDSGPLQDSVSELEETKKLAETYKDQLLRKAAEFENYKRRTEQDFGSLVRNANENLLFSLLPVLDDLDRSLKHGSDQKESDSFYEGIQLIRTKLRNILEGHGLAPFESVGKPFDVEYHDALMQVPNGDYPKNTVVEEIERGYTLNGKVLRHSKVVVSSGAGQPEEDDPPGRPDETKEANG